MIEELCIRIIDMGKSKSERRFCDIWLYLVYGNFRKQIRCFANYIILKFDRIQLNCISNFILDVGVCTMASWKLEIIIS